MHYSTIPFGVGKVRQCYLHFAVENYNVHGSCIDSQNSNGAVIVKLKAQNCLHPYHGLSLPGSQR